MRDLVELAGEDIRERFTKVYQAIVELKKYIKDKYQISTSDISEKAEEYKLQPRGSQPVEGTHFGEAHTVLLDVEKVIHRIFMEQRKKIEGE